MPLYVLKTRIGGISMRRRISMEYLKQRGTRGNKDRRRESVAPAYTGDGHDAYGLTRHSGKHGTICARPFARTPKHAEKYAVLVMIGLHEMDRIAPDSSGRLLPQPEPPKCRQLRDLMERRA